jgi:hypothetical protein
MEKLAANNFFVVRFRRWLSESASGHFPRIDAFCNRSNRGRLLFCGDCEYMCVHLTEFFSFMCLLHNYIERKGKSAVSKRPSIKCGCEYIVHLRQTSREANAPWGITACNLHHTNGCNPTKSSHLTCTQRGKKQWVPVLDTLVGQIGEVPTSAVTRANLQQVRTGFAGVRNDVHVS